MLFSLAGFSTSLEAQKVVNILYAIKMASVEPLKWHNSQSLISQLSNCINFLGCLKTWFFISSYEKCALSRPDESHCSQAYSHLPKEIATDSPAEENCSRTLSQLWRHITIPGELWKMSLSRLNPTDSNFKGLVNPGKWSEVAQSCPTLCDPVDCSLPGSSIHGILQARILEWVAISVCRGSSLTQGSNLRLLCFLH